MAYRLKQIADRWRLTVIGVPLISVGAAIVGELDYAVVAMLLSAIALGMCDTWVHSLRKANRKV